MPPKKKSEPAQVDPTSPEPVRLSTKGEVDESRRVLFSIDDVDYTIPARPRPNLALKFMWQSKTLGEDEAGMNLLIAMLGEEGFEALSNYEALTTEDFIRVMNIAQDVAMGALEAVGKDSADA